jgi:gamma-glutamyltranspeptidase / glutathione hydrolase
MRAGAIACPEPPAAETGERILAQGGSALEAAVAAAVVQGVTNPLGCGLGGMAHIMVIRKGWPAPRFLNASVAVGSRAEPGIFEDAFLGRSERAGRYLIAGDRNQLGYESIMTPGFVRGMEALLETGNDRLPWAQLIEPAAGIAAGGFPVYPYLETYYTFEGADRPGYPDVFRKLAADEAARDRYLPDGRPMRSGELLRQPEYGRTLERLARGGPKEFYRGALGRDMAADFSSRGAFVTATDLESYDIQTAEPVETTFHGFSVYSSPPPAHGTVLLAMLNLAEALDLQRLEWNSPDYVEAVAWATRTAFGDCMPYLADPTFVTVPVAWLTSKERLQGVRRDFTLETGHGGGTPADGHTTHVAALDTGGDMVSITHSIGSIAGAGVMTPGLGFLHNNFMGHFNPLRGYHNSIAPGKRMGGGCPTIVYRDGAPWLAIGSSGGSRLISAVFQTLLNVVLFHMPLDAALAAPRIHSEAGRKIYMEPALGETVAAPLRRRGYEIEETIYMGCNQAVELTPAGPAAASDPRGGRGTGVWPRTRNQGSA